MPIVLTVGGADLCDMGRALECAPGAGQFEVSDLTG